MGTLTLLFGSFVIGFVATLVFYFTATSRTSHHVDKLIVITIAALVAVISLATSVELVSDSMSTAIPYIGNSIGMLTTIVILILVE